MFNWFKKKPLEYSAKMLKAKADSVNYAHEFKSEFESLNPIMEKINQAAEQGAYELEFDYLSDSTIERLKALGFSVEHWECEVSSEYGDIVSWEDA